MLPDDEQITGPAHVEQCRRGIPGSGDRAAQHVREDGRPTPEIAHERGTLVGDGCHRLANRVYRAQRRIVSRGGFEREPQQRRVRRCIGDAEHDGGRVVREHLG